MERGPVATSNLALGRSLNSRVEPRDGGTWIAISGLLDESSNLAPLTTLAGPLTIDLGDLRRINSVGVRYWMDFVTGRDKAGVALVFERLPAIIVGQMTMITHFMGTKAKIKSFLVPYGCPSCHTEQLDVIAIAPGVQIPADRACTKCASRMVLDELAETYDEALRLT